MKPAEVSLIFNKMFNWSGPPKFQTKREGYQCNKNYWSTIRNKKISTIHKFTLKVQQILGSHELKGHGQFWPRQPKNHRINFWLSWICTSLQKKEFIPYVHFWDTTNFRVPWTDWPHSFLTMPTPKIFDQLLIFVNLYQHVKIHLFHLFIHS